MRSTFYCFECLLDNMLSCLSQNLYCNIIRDHITLDQCSHENVFCLRCSRKSNFDLFKSNIDKHLEKLQLLIKTHRFDQCLISITKVDRTPDWCFLDMVFLRPVIFTDRRHKILSFILFNIFHFIILHSLGLIRQKNYLYDSYHRGGKFIFSHHAIILKQL